MAGKVEKRVAGVCDSCHYCNSTSSVGKFACLHEQQSTTYAVALGIWTVTVVAVDHAVLASLRSVWIRVFPNESKAGK